MGVARLLTSLFPSFRSLRPSSGLYTIEHNCSSVDSEVIYITCAHNDNLTIGTKTYVTII